MSDAGRGGRASAHTRLIGPRYSSAELAGDGRARSIPLTMAVMALGGITAIGVFVTISTLLQYGVPDRCRGRVFAAYSILRAVVIAGNLLGGVL